MKINLRKSAIKDLDKLPAIYKSKILKKISTLEQFPNIQNIKKLSNYEPSYRLRVGDYRILFDVQSNEIDIARVLHRKDAY